MEEKIVILGNGFDLRHFLPTSYNHLISILSEIEKLPEGKSNISFSDLFGKTFKEKNEWFYQKINEYYKTENFVFDIEDIKSIKTRLKNNSWFRYFKSVDENKIETWIDFETEIERILISVLEYFESFNRNDFKKPNFGNIGGVSRFFIPIDLDKEYFKNKLQSSLLKSFGIFSEYDRYLIVQEKFILNIGKYIQYYKERDFFNFLYSSLEEFIGIFNDYIVIVINSFYDNFKEEMQANFIINDDIKIFSKVSRIYSFNYTNTFEKFYKVDKDKFAESLERLNINYKRVNEVEFIHGSVMENYNNLEELKIVLGVDDIHDSLKKHKLFQFTKYFQKLHKQTDYLFLKDYQVDETVVKNMEKYTFYFWGHSLDYSDRQYIREVFDLVTKSESKIKVFYHSISAKGDQLKNLLGIIDKEIIENFMKDKRLEFIESSFENLFNELSTIS
ncbi:Bacteriophage abortive infection AbiH [Chryseobacterium arachidis]|uniref:Bacteriophage abortive infection AbiH n=1 Tax=Chryseobacterium arachidis TaxID=1416778 RepID=A0A1M4T4L9_9FLAO|nr:AbiH family protein [Chryseobacterium arachidis]SHE39277.1 Bacteriophage abortive infection AbiH [Chryseobacterium arachidis]